MSLKEQIAAGIKQARKEQGLTQKQLAERLNVNRMTVVRYESGDQNLCADTLDAIAKALGYEVRVLIHSPQ